MASAEEPPLVNDDEGDFSAQVMRIESLCVNCEENGETRLLLHKIPHFRDVILSSFECPHCGLKNQEVQDAGTLPEKGVHYVLHIPEGARGDLDRQVIKGSGCTISIPEIEFDIPPQTQKGEINTIEGVLQRSIEGLTAHQPIRFVQAPELAVKIQSIIDRLGELVESKVAFTFVIDDPSGNSFLENPLAPAPDPQMTTKYYERTSAQLEALGYSTGEHGKDAAPSVPGPPPTERALGTMKVAERVATRLNTYFDVESHAVVIPGDCFSCGKTNECRMCTVEIPHFKEVIIMVTDCVECGVRDTEVRPGGGMGAKGRNITLNVTGPEDLKRDVIKSDSAGICIPELQLQLMPGTLGGKYTTLEGLLIDILFQLREVHQVHSGDSSKKGDKTRMSAFLSKFEQLLTGEIPFTFILDDPLGNVFIANVDPEDHSPPESHPNLTSEEYERTYEQNDEFGINDMKLEGYGETAAAAPAAADAAAADAAADDDE